MTNAHGDTKHCRRRSHEHIADPKNLGNLGLVILPYSAGLIASSHTA